MSFRREKIKFFVDAFFWYNSVNGVQRNANGVNGALCRYTGVNGVLPEI